MSLKQAWINRVKSEFEKSLLVSNVFFGFIMICLEKLVETEFACPCNPEFNAVFVTGFFFVPAFLVFLLMVNIRGCKNKSTKEWGKCVIHSLFPAIVWIILIFLDGQYFACAKTSWSGRHVMVPGSATQKWCQPTNHSSPQELMIRTQELYFVSQAIGVGFTSSLVLALLYEICSKYCSKECPKDCPKYCPKYCSKCGSKYCSKCCSKYCFKCSSKYCSKCRCEHCSMCRCVDCKKKEQDSNQVLLSLIASTSS